MRSSHKKVPRVVSKRPRPFIAHLKKNTLLRPKVTWMSERNTIELNLLTPSNIVAGTFSAQQYVGNRAWDIKHRWIRPSVGRKRGYDGNGVGSTALNIIENEIRSHGGTLVRFNTILTIDVLCFSLKNGYQITGKDSYTSVKRALGIPLNHPLPPTTELIRLLKQRKDNDLQGFVSAIKKL